jgi:rhamnose utilization protein RhaD (predicted bifunctional aldolase and dehydrogenase)
MENGIMELIEISQFYGKDKEYIIAGGGNTSFKNEDFLWIKASGVALSNITEDGFVKMSRNKLKIISERTYSTDPDEREAQVKEDLAAAVISDDGKRPSVETSMHDVINYPYVVHTHPTVVNSLTCSENSRALAYEILGNNVLFIEYIDPGYVLFKKVAEEIKDYQEKNGKVPQIILLENHGIFVSGDSIEEIKSIYADAEMKILSYIGYGIPKINPKEFDPGQELLQIYAEKNVMDPVIKAYSDPIIDEFVKDINAFSEIATAFTPDHIVYCKSKYLFADDFSAENLETKIQAFSHQFGFLPRIIGMKNKGLVIIGDSNKSVAITFELILNMIKISWLARKLGKSKPMSQEQIAFIENWEVENYRKKMAK